VHPTKYYQTKAQTAPSQGFKWKPTVKGSFPSTVNTTITSPNQNRPSTPTDPCSHWYPGQRPFEAPEVNNIANFVSTLPNLMAFVDLRSYGQMRASSPLSLVNGKR
jgi:extracellular matrix protein 14